VTPYFTVAKTERERLVEVRRRCKERKTKLGNERQVYSSTTDLLTAWTNGVRFEDKNNGEQRNRT